ncbi:HypC/HybG/HupF family hydrogenase formation chaperone [Clostridium sp. CX1]|uniref:HypC/HybG/HupF family hydrogenase formation chaperone n=1 Tax=Clostridium sp. CX1 TaxID=2978346 RepID=UPI0021C23D3F|nr:HypC/HybG/HupF family hydrogenase formation chaperone [Clostridium sp. CX1]MCT8976681.1 HypC/HybG/HupF family hydrogenase formation chaperone [Clostridium sp. CX1]
MCLSVPGKIVKIQDSIGTVEIGTIKREVFLHLVPEVKAGEYVLIHAGCAIETIDEEEAEKTLKIIRELDYDEIC